MNTAERTNTDTDESLHPDQLALFDLADGDT